MLRFAFWALEGAASRAAFSNVGVYMQPLQLDRFNQSTCSFLRVQMRKDTLDLKFFGSVLSRGSFGELLIA